MMIKKISVLLLLTIIIFGKKINAQDSLIVDKPKYANPKFILSTKISALIHPRLPAVMVGGEFFLGKKWSINQEVGFVLQKKQNQSRLNQRGLRSLTELRWYPFDLEIDDVNFYLGIQYRAWKLSFETDNTFCRYGCLYQQRLDYEVQQSAMGINGALGFYFTLGRRIILDTGLSLGYIIRKNRPNIPEDAEILQQTFFSFSRPVGERFTANEPAFLFWLKAGYAF